MSFNYPTKAALGCQVKLDTCSYESYNSIMISVGIRDLKNKLSQYLRLVKEGKTVLVKDRNEIVAEIRKYNPESVKLGLEAYLEAEALQGRIISAKRSTSNI